MLTLNQVTLRRGARTLFQDASFTIFPGQRVGLVGRNGTGKSSLFQMILGELAADIGDLSLPRGLIIAVVAQETPALPQPAIEYALDGDTELRRIERDLAVAEASGDVARIAKLHDRMAAIGGYAATARAARLLNGLGFDTAMQQRAVADFSGGWRMRLNLARALMCRSDLLLLDEPTNHLDLDAVIWLQDWLSSYEGTLLLISHDREFLDAVTTQTLHLQDGRLTLYSGNYSQFERLRAERLSQQSAMREQQLRQVAHLQAFVDRFKAQATKARQAQSRMKMIERIQVVAAANVDSEFSFSFRAPLKLPSPMLRMDKLSVGYGGTAQLSGLKLGIEPGHRIGLLGPNGAGKSTLVRLLAGELEPMAGELKRAPDLKIGYFAQHQLEHLDLKASPLTHLRRLDPEATEQGLRDYLGGFNFRGDRVFEAIEPFSGGEKARLALALVVYPRPNLLLLDEPTNHLDLDMRHALEVALQDYTGAMLLVSHDRHLVASCCDTLWRVADGRCEPFDGDLEDYAAWLTGRAREAAAPAKSTAGRGEREKPLRDSIRKLDQQMEKLQSRLRPLEEKLGDATLYESARKKELDKLLTEQTDIKRQLDEAEAKWLAAMEELEAL